MRKKLLCNRYCEISATLVSCWETGEAQIFNNRVQFWPPYLGKDIAEREEVQKRATEIVRWILFEEEKVNV